MHNSSLNLVPGRSLAFFPNQLAAKFPVCDTSRDNLMHVTEIDCRQVEGDA